MSFGFLSAAETLASLERRSSSLTFLQSRHVLDTLVQDARLEQPIWGPAELDSQCKGWSQPICNFYVLASVRLREPASRNNAGGEGFYSRFTGEERRA